MKLAALFSGGKDSTFAIMKALKSGHEISCLITMAPKSNESYMFHHPCVGLTRFQADSMGIRHIWRDTEGNKEVELDDLRAAIESVKGEIEGVLSGAVSSRYQKTRIESICSQLGLESISPLWGMDPYKLLKEEVEMMDIIVVAVSTAGLDSRWLGKRLGDAEVDELHRISQKSHFNIQFEGGEAETFVADCPLFSKRIEIEDYDKVWDSTTSSGYIQVKEVNLIQKRI